MNKIYLFFLMLVIAHVSCAMEDGSDCYDSESMQRREQIVFTQEKCKRKAQEVEAGRQARYGQMSKLTQSIMNLIMVSNEKSGELKKLLEKNTKDLLEALNSKNMLGQTPLMVAAGRGSLSKCQVLVDYGAGCKTFNWDDNMGVLAYALSVRDKHPKIVLMLCDFLCNRGAHIGLDSFLQADRHSDLRIMAYLVRRYLMIPIDKNYKIVSFNLKALEMLKKLIIDAQERTKWMLHWHPLNAFNCGYNFENSVRSLVLNYPPMFE